MDDLLKKAITQEHLSKDTVDTQFCSDWLKREMHRLFDENEKMRRSLNWIVNNASSFGLEAESYVQRARKALE